MITRIVTSIIRLSFSDRYLWEKSPFTLANS